jgi:hypothetical protein
MDNTAPDHCRCRSSSSFAKAAHPQCQATDVKCIIKQKAESRIPEY